MVKLTFPLGLLIGLASSIVLIVTFFQGNFSVYVQKNVASFPAADRNAQYLSLLSKQSQSKNDQNHSHASAADALSKIKVLCFVETCEKNLKSKAAAVKDTWAKRCDKTLYISEKSDPDFPAITFKGVMDGHNRLWSKTSLTFKYLYENYLDQFHWFLKADDDTYVVIENLKFFLSSHSPEQPLYFGKRFKALKGYNSGGAGYVLSREALRRFGKLLASDDKHKKCSRTDSVEPEDFVMSTCLRNAGVEPGNSLDATKKETFHCFQYQYEFGTSDLPDWYYKYSYYEIKRGFDCCSNYTISFHYMRPIDMKTAEFFLYYLRPFGTRMEKEFKLHEAYNKLDKTVKLKKVSAKKVIMEPPPFKTTLSVIEKNETTVDKDDASTHSHTTSKSKLTKPSTGSAAIN